MFRRLGRNVATSSSTRAHEKLCAGSVTFRPSRVVIAGTLAAVYSAGVDVDGSQPNDR